MRAHARPGSGGGHGRARGSKEEVIIRHEDGEDRYVHVNAAPVYRAGVISAGIVIFHDITDRKKAEAEREKMRVQLSHSQKMESVGRLAGGVAHDFNNMLGVILGNAQLALRAAGPSATIRQDLVEIEKAARRAADLTRQLLAFARKQATAPVAMNLNQTIAGMLKMLTRLIGEDIELAWLPGPDLWTVKIDPSQVDQIMANLCVNARDAISNVGRITIETKNVHFEEPPRSEQDAKPGAYVMLAVSDSGCGMDRATLAMIFEPFFTTKQMGKGTGLGLATVYGIVRQNEGFVDVWSEPGKGSVFRIYLPRHEAGSALRVEDDSGRGAQPQAGSETVLLVEDEPLILRVATTMLTEFGYTVLPAATPGEAIRLTEGHASRIQLLITDVILPEMNGRELAQRLHQSRPDLKCLFMSGYTASVIAHHGVLDEGVHFIQKPFSIVDFTTKVREALDS